MSDAFAEKLDLVLKALSISRGRLAADLSVDKSVVGRWVTGAVQPSAHNLTRLTALIQRHVPGFTMLDWDRGLAELAGLMGVERAVGEPATRPPLPNLPLPVLEQIRATTALRGGAYEGFFRSTRPWVLNPGGFLHDHGMVRRHENGLLELRMGTAGTFVEGWMLPLQNQVFVIAADVTSGAMLFGIFNGVATSKAMVVDGLALGSALDAGRTPTSHVMVFERVGDLSGDPAADEARFLELAASDPVAPPGSVSEALRKRLLPDTGPAAFAIGGDLLLQTPASRSISSGGMPAPE